MEKCLVMTVTIFNLLIFHIYPHNNPYLIAGQGIIYTFFSPIPNLAGVSDNYKSEKMQRTRLIMSENVTQCKN
jgi:hypothetical protein